MAAVHRLGGGSTGAGRVGDDQHALAEVHVGPERVHVLDLDAELRVGRAGHAERLACLVPCGVGAGGGLDCFGLVHLPLAPGRVLPHEDTDVAAFEARGGDDGERGCPGVGAAGPARGGTDAACG